MVLYGSILISIIVIFAVFTLNLSWLIVGLICYVLINLSFLEIMEAKLTLPDHKHPQLVNWISGIVFLFIGVPLMIGLYLIRSKK